MVTGIVLQVVSIVILLVPFDIEATLAFIVTSTAAQVAWLIGFVVISELYIWKGMCPWHREKSKEES